MVREVDAREASEECVIVIYGLPPHVPDAFVTVTSEDKYSTSCKGPARVRPLMFVTVAVMVPVCFALL